MRRQPEVERFDATNTTRRQPEVERQDASKAVYRQPEAENQDAAKNSNLVMAVCLHNITNRDSGFYSGG
ncbi:hypothetical protein DPMN_000382 [Dreissena polymorpha]|uniref:Uncharacterized protein n=1 Tax=Dreissena polymorpha TaxID=45954 RepID=A0A9D4MJM3_DREPO|nr:hypothetical protein DPMN_000382 [Dreissena polymorpha]